MQKPTIEETRAMLDRVQHQKQSGARFDAAVADTLVYYCEPLLERIDALEAELAKARELAEPVVGTAGD